MRSERQKMLDGELYDPLDPDLVAARVRARDLCQTLNATTEAQQDERRRILRELFAAGGDSVWMQPPFFCDYGSNIELGERVFFNVNCIVLDVCSVRIGSFSLFGPAVQIYTPMHPMNAEQRVARSSASPSRSDPMCGSVAERSFSPASASVHAQSSARAVSSHATFPRMCSRRAIRVA